MIDTITRLLFKLPYSVLLLISKPPAENTVSGIAHKICLLEIVNTIWVNMKKLHSSDSFFLHLFFD